MGMLCVSEHTRRAQVERRFGPWALSCDFSVFKEYVASIQESGSGATGWCARRWWWSIRDWPRPGPTWSTQSLKINQTFTMALIAAPSQCRSHSGVGSVYNVLGIVSLFLHLLRSLSPPVPLRRLLLTRFWTSFIKFFLGIWRGVEWAGKVDSTWFFKLVIGGFHPFVLSMVATPTHAVAVAGFTHKVTPEVPPINEWSLRPCC